MKTIYNQSFSDTKADAGIVQSIPFTQIAYDLRFCVDFSHTSYYHKGALFTSHLTIRLSSIHIEFPWSVPVVDNFRAHDFTFSQ